MNFYVLGLSLVWDSQANKKGKFALWGQSQITVSTHQKTTQEEMPFDNFTSAKAIC